MASQMRLFFTALYVFSFSFLFFASSLLFSFSVQDLFRGYLPGHLGQSGQPSGHCLNLAASRIISPEESLLLELSLFAVGWRHFIGLWVTGFMSVRTVHIAAL